MDLPRLPDRPADSHKGDFGRIVIVAGSRGMAGAAALAGLSALRSGAGLVTVATARVCQETVASFHPSLMTVGLPSNEHGMIEVDSYDTLCELIPPADCMAIGPGLGQSESLHRLLLSVYSSSSVPVVIDADGLNNIRMAIDRQSSAAPRILTPHPGELRRLAEPIGPERADLETAAAKLAEKTESLVVLKGSRTLITDGRRLIHNQTGNAGMATAGSGDVLTGIIAALVGQGLSPIDACVLGCHVHGLAGDLAVRQTGMVGLISTDLIEQLPHAFMQLY